MRKLPFPLQAVHDLRELRREEAERELARAAAAVVAATAHLEAAARLHAETAERYAPARTGAIDAQEAALRANYLVALALRVREAQAQLAAREREYETQRQRTEAAARAAEVTAKLRERHHARHAAEMAWEEQKQLDEMASLAQARRRLGTS
jgi:flagellar export protein FliJ